MDVTQLRTLVYVAELGSLSKAADRLCTAQPALSRHVRLLEEELGTRLFDRHGRGMVLTEQGRTVLQHAQRIMAEFEDIRSSVAEENGTLGGRVSIGMPPTVAEVLAVPIVEAIRKFYYSDVSAMLVLIVITVSVIDTVTSHVRHRLIGLEDRR